MAAQLTGKVEDILFVVLHKGNFLLNITGISIQPTNHGGR